MRPHLCGKDATCGNIELISELWGCLLVAIFAKTGFFIYFSFFFGLFPCLFPPPDFLPVWHNCQAFAKTGFFIYFSFYSLVCFLACFHPTFGIIARRSPRLDNGTDRWTSGAWTAQDRLGFSTQSDSESSSVGNNHPTSPFKGLMELKLDSTLSIYTEPPWF